MIDFPGLEVKVYRRDVEHFLGYPMMSPAPERVSIMIADELKEAAKLIQPEGGLEILTIQEATSLFLPKEERGEADIKTVELLGKAEKIVVFVATIGGLVEGRLRVYEERKDRSKAHLLEAIGIVAVEKLAAEVEKEVSGLASRLNYLTTPRFTPGQGGLDLSLLKGILGALDRKKIGVHLGDDGLMVPRKSVAGFFCWTKSKDSA